SCGSESERPVAALPCASTAEQSTVVTPSGKAKPEAGLQLTVTEPSTMSVAVAVKLTGVPPPPLDGVVIVPGSVREGGVVSCTVTLKPIVLVSIVTVSVKVHDTGVVPMENVPGPGEQEADGAPLSSSTPLRE